jgi:2-polyprenyl-3-methyl-5-hydroxy-6-metoxy-1,4-benzoquinol methylase
MNSQERLTPNDPAYSRLVQQEVQHYSEIFLGGADRQSAQEILMQPVPPSWVEVEKRAADLVRKATGFDLNGHVLERLRSDRRVRMLSLGSGPGGLELAFAREASGAEITCIDLNADLIRLGQIRAEAEQLNVRFEVGDLNLIDLLTNEYDLVFCHASLHHVLELERLLEQIKNSLRDRGSLITVDVCTRNGYLMWPETREIVGSLFRTLPARFRMNHTAYGSARVDEEIWEADTSAVSMECIRAQDIIPTLSETFVVQNFVPYFSLCRRFLDTMYGPNYDLTQSLDTAMVNWIWELDRYYLDSNRLKPETFFGIYGK